RTDCVFVAARVAGCAVMAQQVAGGPTAGERFDIPGVARETALLLVSSITYGFANNGAQRGRLGAFFAWLAVTFELGA
ncbi:cytochrome o ubiquinol oxidase subunit III, partial [Burkholderia pseudomallei]